MSVDFGASGVFGIYLDGQEFLQPVLKELKDYVQAEQEKAEAEDESIEPDDLSEIPEFCKMIYALFLAEGVKVPETACLLWTGNDDERPGCCDTPSEKWILGFGLFCDPSRYPTMDKSFIDLSAWHTWVWAG